MSYSLDYVTIDIRSHIHLRGILNNCVNRSAVWVRTELALVRTDSNLGTNRLKFEYELTVFDYETTRYH